MNFSKILSYLLHPILMPIIVLYIGINNVDYFYLIFYNYSNNLYLIILAFTMALPLISAILFVKSGRVESLEMRKKEERRGPLFMSALIMGIGFPIFYSIAKLSFHLSSIYISSIILLSFAFLITIRWKISLHMLGVGGVVGAFFAIQQNFSSNIILFNALIFCAGLVGFSRINENAHTLKQVYGGFLLGFILEKSIFLF